MLKLIFLACLSASLLAKVTIYENESILTAYDKVIEMNKKYGEKNVMVVFDVDNTLLSPHSNLGSDQWYVWQRCINKAVKAQKNGTPLSNDQKDCIEQKKFEAGNNVFDSLDIIYKYYPQKAAEDITALVIKRLQALGNNVMALTSRGHGYAYQTMRDLLKNDIDLTKTSIRVLPKFFSKAPSYNLDTVYKDYSFDPSVKIKKGARDVQYIDGVFYTSGLKKGVMLKIFLQEANYAPKAIIFMDDKQKHSDSMKEVFDKYEVELHSFRYSLEDENVNQFRSSNKEVEAHEWLELMNILKK